MKLLTRFAAIAALAVATAAQAQDYPAKPIRIIVPLTPGSGADIAGRIIARHLTADQCKPRKVLYEDPELGFCICGHVYEKPAHGAPHDHGPSWAIYGQAIGVTEMTDWKIVKKGTGDEPSLVEPVRVYKLEPGMAKFYDVGAVHSPKRDSATKLIRVEGKNLDTVKRSNIKQA